MIRFEDSTPHNHVRRWTARLGRALCALAAVVAAAAGWADTKAAQALPPAELFFKPEAIQEVVLSPSGKRLAMSRPGSNGRVGVFVVDLQGQDFKATRAILFDDGDVRSFSWVDDERLVFTVTDLKAGLGEAYRQAPGLYAVRHDGEEFTMLVDIRNRPRFANEQRIKTLPWNHTLLHVPVPSEERGGARANEVIVGEMSFSGNELISLAPMWLNTRTGRTRSLEVGRLPCLATKWWFSARGEPRAARCADGGRESLYWYQASRDGQHMGAWKRIAEGPVHDPGIRPLWVGEGDTLFVEHPAGPAGEAVVAPFDFEKNAPGEALVIAPGFDFSGALIGDRDGRQLLGARLSIDAETTVWFDGRYKATQQRVDAALPRRVNRIQCRRCGSADAVVLVRSYSDRDPGELLLFRQADNEGKGRWLRVGRVRPDIQAEQMAFTTLHRIQARDGRDLPVWVTQPAAAGRALPAVVLVHGGPWVRGRHWHWEAIPQFLASRGWLVIEPEFRGSAGYGQAHLRAGFRQWGQAMQDDVADALVWARRQGLATDSACIVGGSYGGYSTLMGLIRHPELYRCGSAWVAVTDPFLFLEGSWWVADDVSSQGRRFSLPQMVGDAEKDREMLRAHSPVAQAARIQRPVQLVWGGEDLRVPIAHGKRLRDAMQQTGQPPEWIVYDDEAHGIRKTENMVDFARKLENFLARHLRDTGTSGR